MLKIKRSVSGLLCFQARLRSVKVEFSLGIHHLRERFVVGYRILEVLKVIRVLIQNVFDDIVTRVCSDPELAAIILRLH